MVPPTVGPGALLSSLQGLLEAQEGGANSKSRVWSLKSQVRTEAQS